MRELCKQLERLADDVEDVIVDVYDTGGPGPATFTITVDQLNELRRIASSARGVANGFTESWI